MTNLKETLTCLREELDIANGYSLYAISPALNDELLTVMLRGERGLNPHPVRGSQEGFERLQSGNKLYF